MIGQYWTKAEREAWGDPIGPQTVTRVEMRRILATVERGIELLRDYHYTGRLEDRCICSAGRLCQTAEYLAAVGWK